jgi:flagellar hook-associated protein 2
MSTVSFSGLASGIDGDAIIQATIDSRRLTKVPLENRIEQNNAEVSALEELRKLVGKLEGKLRQFASFSGGSISKTVTSSNEHVLTAAVSGNAVPGTLSLTVQQLAASARLTFDSTFDSPDSLVAPSLEGKGVISLHVGTGDSKETVEIEVDNKTTLSSLALAVSDKLPGKASASLINVGTDQNPQFRLMVSTLETGVEKGTFALELDETLQGEGIFDQFHLLQAQDAVLHVDGIGTIQRGKNSINNLVPGLSLEIKDVSTLPTIVRIDNDSGKTAGRVNELLEVFNEIVRFVNEGNRINRVEDERGVRNEFGALARTRVDTQLLNSLRGAISGTSLDEPGAVRIFADLGITTDRTTGELSFDREVFENAMASDGGRVSRLLEKFADQVASTGGVISNYTNFNGLFDQAKNSKKAINDSIVRRLEQIESGIERQREFLKRMFARLEETIGQLNSNASALSGIITQNSKK